MRRAVVPYQRLLRPLIALRLLRLMHPILAAAILTYAFLPPSCTG